MIFSSLARAKLYGESIFRQFFRHLRVGLRSWRCLMALAILWPSLIQAADITLRAPATALLGDVITIEATASGLGAGSAPSVSSYDLDLQFDPAVFAHLSTTFSDALGDPSVPEALASWSLNPGGVNVVELSLLPPATLQANQSDSVVIFTVQFTVIGASAQPSPLTIAGDLADVDGSPLTINVATLSVTTADPAASGRGPSPSSAVPVPVFSPPLLLLLTLSLPLVVWLERRRISS